MLSRSLVTASWWRVPQRFVPVAVSLGIPPEVGPVPALRLATLPKALWGTEDWPTAYRDLLDRRAARLLSALEDLRDCYGPLALACWEPDPGTLDAPRCHRIVLADWLGARGVVVERVS